MITIISMVTNINVVMIILMMEMIINIGQAKQRIPAAKSLNQ